MKTMKTIQLVGLFVMVGFIAVSLTSCKKEEVLPAPVATVNVLSTTNKSGDIKGNGGSTTKTWTFANPNTKAGWDMSISATKGSFRLVLKDASGTTRLDQTLTAGSGPQSASGTTLDGTAGTWTSTITLTDFNGSGDFSFL